MGRLATGTRLRLAELVRQPTTLAMLVALPPAVVETYGVAMESFPAVASTGVEPATAGRTTGTLFAVAFLAGLVGLFQVISARGGDERLAVAGFPRSTMLASRVLTLVAVAAIAAGVAFGAFAARVDVAAPALAFATLLLAGLLYGLVGVVVGAVIPRELEGSLVLVFLADVDNALSSGLFPVEATVPLALVGDVSVVDLAPLAHPHELFTVAVLEGTLAEGHLLPALVWVLVLLVAALAAYGRSTGDGWLDGVWSA